MPYFAWRGIHITGRMRKGRLFARSAHELDQILFKRDIALLRGKQTRDFTIIRRIKESERILFLRQLATLLSAGILLPDALRIVAEQLDSPRMQEDVHKIADEVHSGVLLSDALTRSALGLSGMVIQMVHVGQEAGILGASLSAMSDYAETMEGFRKKIKAALIMPIITLLFFCAIALMIFIVIIPKFAVLFHSMHQELPLMTQRMMQMSDALFGWRLYFYGFLGVVGSLVIRAYCKTTVGKQAYDGLAIRMPLIGDGIKQRTFFGFFSSLALMLKGGMPLIAALALTRRTIANAQLQDYVGSIERDVAAGSSLSQAMMQLADPVFTPDVIAMVRVGEESGCLPIMLNRVAALYQECIYRMLMLMTTGIQPLLMIILGLLITALIFAVYMPIFNLSYAVG